MLRLTPVVKNIVMINVMVYIMQMVFPALENWLALSNVSTPYFKPYQLFTYMFAHGGLFHIFFNMLALSFLGPMLESFWGPKRFLLFYLITGIGAGAFNILIDLFFGVGSFTSMVGASGAVYGVLTAFGVLFPNLEMMLLFPPIPIKAKYLVMILGGIAIYSGFSANPGDNTAHFAHLGGIVVAFILLQFWRGRGN